MISIFVLNSAGLIANDNIRGIAGISYTENEDSDNNETKSADVDFKYYFPSVDKKSHPWFEAEFLERAASLSLQLGKNTSTFSNSETKYVGTNYSIAGKYASQSSPLIAALAYSAFDREDEGTFIGSSEGEYFTIALGAYINKSLAITALLRDGESTFTGKSDPSLNSKGDVTAYGLNAKLVYELTSQQAISAVLNLSFSEFKSDRGLSSEVDAYILDVTYYFTPQVGISGEFQYNDGKSAHSKNYGLGIKGFVTRHLVLLVNFEKYDYSSERGSDEWQVSLEYWF